MNEGTKPNSNTPNENNRQEQVRPWTTATKIDENGTEIHDNIRFHSRWLRRVEVDGIANEVVSRSSSAPKVPHYSKWPLIRFASEYMMQMKFLCCADRTDVKKQGVAFRSLFLTPYSFCFFLVPFLRLPGSARFLLPLWALVSASILFCVYIRRKNILRWQRIWLRPGRE